MAGTIYGSCLTAGTSGALSPARVQEMAAKLEGAVAASPELAPALEQFRKTFAGKLEVATA